MKKIRSSDKKIDKLVLCPNGRNADSLCLVIQSRTPAVLMETDLKNRLSELEKSLSFIGKRFNKKIVRKKQEEIANLTLQGIKKKYTIRSSWVRWDNIFKDMEANKEEQIEKRYYRIISRLTGKANKLAELLSFPCTLSESEIKFLNNNHKSIDSVALFNSTFLSSINKLSDAEKTEIKRKLQVIFYSLK